MMEDCVVLTVRTYPDPVLDKRAGSVKRIDRDLLRLAEEMFETMYEEHGVGLAAPQVGESIRMCVVNCTDSADGEMVLINPVITEATGEETSEEGCLSVPGVHANVTRAARIRVRAYDRNGKEIEIEADGLQARALQHELDHLNGRLFFQLLGEAARMTVKGRLRTLEEGAG